MRSWHDVLRRANVKQLITSTPRESVMEQVVVGLISDGLAGDAISSGHVADQVGLLLSSYLPESLLVRHTRVSDILGGSAGSAEEPADKVAEWHWAVLPMPNSTEAERCLRALSVRRSLHGLMVVTPPWRVNQMFLARLELDGWVLQHLHLGRTQTSWLVLTKFERDEEEAVGFTNER